jgi:hypothetical protein
VAGVVAPDAVAIDVVRGHRPEGAGGLPAPTGDLEVDGAFLHNLPGVSVRHGRQGRGSLYFDKTDDRFGFLDITDPDTGARIVTGARCTDHGGVRRG